MSLNVDEFGDVVRVNMREDVSSATSYTMTLQPKVGDTLEKTATLGTVDVTYEGEDLLANNYIEYTIADGDLEYAGQWRKKGKAVISSTKEIVSNYEFFTVLE